MLITPVTSVVGAVVATGWAARATVADASLALLVPLSLVAVVSLLFLLARVEHWVENVPEGDLEAVAQPEVQPEPAASASPGLSGVLS